MLHLFPQALLVASAFGTLQLVVERPRRAAPGEAPTAAVEPASPARLPDRLRGARLFAVEAEDHYLRFHTDRGSDLLLMRMSDAVAELEGQGGTRIHRSWWVARDAIAAVHRSGGRATLRLVNGLVVPVSRRHAPLLRREGWFQADGRAP
jgi:DNA-binding LytR/AlgR family response regulator